MDTILYSAEPRWVALAVMHMHAESVTCKTMYDEYEILRVYVCMSDTVHPDEAYGFTKDAGLR